MNKLTRNEQIMVGGGVLMLVASFLPWHRAKICVGGGEFFGTDLPQACQTFSASGWESPSSPWVPLATILAVAMVAAVVVDKLTSADLPDLGSISWGQIHMGAGIAVAALVLLKLLDEASHLGIGFYLGVVAAAALAYGGVMLGLDARKGGGTETAPPPPPPPPAGP